MPAANRVDTVGNEPAATVVEIAGGLRFPEGPIALPAGDVLRYVEMPDRLPTNICFGGPDLTTAYVTLCQHGTLARFAWPDPGLPLNFLTT